MLDTIRQLEFELWAQSNPLQAVTLLLVSLFVLRAIMRCLSATAPLVIKRATQWSGLHNLAYTKVVPPVVSDCIFPYGAVTLQGRRVYQEDRSLVLRKPGGDANFSLYAVFDGHGGDYASQFCVDAFSGIFSKFVGSSRIQDPGDALDNTFKEIDRQFLDICKEKRYGAGSTAIAILTTEEEFTVANTGDSRALLVKSNGNTKPLSVDHKPQRADERERVQGLGGHVVYWGVWRVEGILAVSRAIGDPDLKKFVIPDPEITKTVRSNDDAFLVLATDGLWDVMTNIEVGLFLEGCTDAQIASDMLVSEAFGRGSRDNITVVVVDISKERNTQKNPALDTENKKAD